MALPFKFEKERKFQCFVCGMLYGNFEEYKEHIFSKHEENKDYIVCPHETCGTPIRDLKMHWKAKHKSSPMPAQKMDKAIVWRDRGEKKGATGKRKKRNRFRQGTFVSQKNKKEFQYRSGLECELFEILETVSIVKQYDYESIEIPYTFDGKSRKYIPDYIVVYQNGDKEVLEVKPSSQTDLPINKAKWDAAEAYCKFRGWTFNVINEIGIRKLKAKLRKVKK